MPGIIVFAAFRTSPDNMRELIEIVRRKREFMVSVGYYTKRDHIVMRSESDPDLLIEVVEWTSREAIDKAHNDERALKIWKEMEDLCYEVGSKLSSFPEADRSFPGFTPVQTDSSH